jgi:hypothetical protein
VKLRRLKKFLIRVTILFVLVAAWLTYYLAKPLQPPDVSIELQGFNPEKMRVFHLKPDTNFNGRVFFEGEKEDWWFRAFPSFQNFPTEQTNAFCTLHLTNRGSTRIWWISMDCQVEARTPNGWVTNEFSHFTTSPWSVGSSSKDIFNVFVPIDAMEWRVTGDYEYYKRHNMRLEYYGWLVDDLKLGQAVKSLPKIAVYPLLTVGWVFALLPEPRKKIGEIHSEFFTNHPVVVAPVTLTKL